MFALARKMVFGLLATTLVIGTAHVAMAKPPLGPHYYVGPHYYHGPHYYRGPAVVVNSVGVYYGVSPVNPVPAEIQLINPATNQVALKYVLNGSPVRVLPAGSSIAIHRESVVEFDRGGAMGWGRYALTDGNYTFVPASGVWTLVHETAETVADDTTITAANPAPVN
jgi:hypothetical protein